MNLINDEWIPVRLKNSTIRTIAPWQITEEEIIELASPRPDFNGAMIQFLIGLLQTTCAPEYPKDWRQRLTNPPTSEELKQAFTPIQHAFNLDGEKPRFMQDSSLAKEEGNCNIDALLIEVPGENTLKENKDHFIKRGDVNQFCPACTAMALFTLQTNAPSGGAGHRTGLRGGGPLTTIILGENLWGTVWLNIMEKDVFLAKSRDCNKIKDADSFPWLDTTRIGKETTPEDVHPNQNFWAMPRRVWLISQGLTGVCSLCGKESNHLYRKYVTKNYGINYNGAWLHPLSPYYIDKNGSPSTPIHPQPGGIGYRDWLGLVQNDPDKNRKPAMIIEHFIQHRRKDLRLWAFGYDMDNMKARCWYEGIMPLVSVDDELRGEFEIRVTSLILTAQMIARETKTQIKKAWFDPKHKTKGDLSFVESRFWQETEAEFYHTLYALKDVLTNKTDVIPVLEVWHN
ncbi:MAG: type I-E CRISPR-associated protein Cse1/CasA, partial [Candidatus Desantisbacteria bacterium]